MASWIILLRGVTPTGRNKVPMAPLRAALEEAGLARVRTWIQSGNVLADSRLGRLRLETLVHDVIAREFGGDIAVLARTRQELQALLDRNPYRKADPSKVSVTLLSGVPDEGRVKDLLAVDFAPDEITVVGDTVFGRVADAFATFKATNNFIERRLRLTATTRISRTMTKLLELSTRSRSP